MRTRWPGTEVNFRKLEDSSGEERKDSGSFARLHGGVTTDGCDTMAIGVLSAKPGKRWRQWRVEWWEKRQEDQQ